MRKILITTDVEIKSELGLVTIQNKDNDLLINISSASVVAYSLRTYLGFKNQIRYSKNIKHDIILMISNKKILSVEKGQINYFEKWWLFKFILNSIIKKGI